MFFFEFPDEVKLKIFSYCDAKTLAKVACVSKDWHRLTEDNNLWHKEAQKLVEGDIEKQVGEHRSWKAIYIDSYKNLQGLADKLYKVFFQDKPDDIDLTSDYANYIIEDVLELYEEAISEKALTRMLLNKYPLILTQEDNHNHTLLHWLVASGLPEAVQMVLEEADKQQVRIYSLNEEEGYRLVDSRNREGFTPLHFGLINCPQERHDELVKIVAMCLERGADLTVTDAINGWDFQQELQECEEGGLIEEEHYQRINDLIRPTTPMELI